MGVRARRRDRRQASLAVGTARAGDVAGWQAHDKAALVAAGIGAGAAFAAGALDPFAFALAAAALAVAWGRGRGAALARLLERPRVFTALSAVYLPVFFVDLFLSGSGPVAALDRLVVFLLVAEVLSGNPRLTHRPVLLGLLLVVSTAAETTEIWFALPMAAFVLAAIAAQLRTTMLEHQPAGETAPPTLRAGPLAGVTVGSLVLGTLIFFSIPRIGAGWGRQLATQKGQSETSLETGLAESVSLGTVGRVKIRRRVAFKATLSDTTLVNPDAIYWRARPFSRWTGQGWIEDTGDRGVVLTLPVGRAVRVPGEPPSESAGLVAEIDMRLDRAPALIAPGRVTWIKTPVGTQLLASSDGALTHPEGRIPRRYEVAVRTPRAPRLGAPASGPAGAPPIVETREAIASRNLRREYPGSGEDTKRGIGAVYLETGMQPDTVLSWARGVAPDQSDPLRIARAFVADLSRRPYDLDTRGIDPSRPIASFLEGAPGHCEYFASAMVLGLRARGIPSRVVGGFLGADRATFGREYVVRESRAHMWVEAHIPGSGWTTFDPTPEEGRDPPSQWQGALRDGWERMVLTWDALVIGFDISNQADIVVWAREAFASAKDHLMRHGALIASLLGTLAAGVFLLVARRRRRGVVSGPGISGIPEVYRRFLVHAAHRGVRPAPGETARELAGRAGDALGDPQDVALVSLSYERQRFGGLEPSRDEIASVRAALGRLLRSRPARAPTAVLP